MMDGIMIRASAVARAAQASRLQQIAATMRNEGVAVEAGVDSVIVRGRGLVQKWLADPLLRFAARNAS